MGFDAGCGEDRQTGRALDARREIQTTSRRATKAITALAACVALLVVGVPQASAVLYRLPHGHGNASYEGILGKRTPTNVRISPPQGAEALSQTSDFFHDSLGYLNYSGGPVMSSNKNYVVDWEPSNYSGPAHGSGSGCGFPDSNGDYGPCTGYVQGVGTFFQDLQASSGSSSINDSVATQYTAAGATPGTPNFNSSYGGTLTDHDPLPASNGCPAAPSVSGGRCITDAQLQTELQSFLSAHSEPGGLTNEYFVLTPPGIATCFDGGGSQCSGNAGPGGSAVFCAYHSRSSKAGRYLYSNIPDMDNIDGCDPFVSGSPSGNNDDCALTTCIWPNGWADGVLSAVSHEHNESITDPEPNNAWADWSQLRNQPGDENGDKCNADAADDPNTQWNFNGGTDNFGDETPWNETVGSHHYWIQMMWSNQNLQCTSHWTATASPGAFFKVSGESGRTMHFDASQSCGASASCSIAQYSWQFNDYHQGAQCCGQNYTVVTQNASLAHTFPRTGNYRVALTTMNPDGRSRGYSALVHVDGTPPVISAVSVPGGQTVRSIIANGFKVGSHLNEAGTERGTLQITAAKAQQLGIPRTIGTGTLAFTAAATKTMTMNLTATAKNKLRNQNNLAVTATLNATDKAGNHAAAVSKSTTLPH